MRLAKVRPQIALGGATLAATVACGWPPAPTPEPARSAPPTEAAPPSEAVVEPEPAGAAPSLAIPVVVPPTGQPVIPPNETPSTGLPAVSVGPAIRLTPLPITTPEVDGRRIASVTLGNATAQANLDAWFEQHAWCRVRVQLAIEGFVSHTCSYEEPSAGWLRLGMNVRVTPAGEVVPLTEEDLFVPGTDIRAMVRVWSDRPDFDATDVVFGPFGAVARSPDDETVDLPWRWIAPYLRSDGPLAPALTAAGLTLAPEGTTAPPSPALTSVLSFEDATTLVVGAASLPADLRARTFVRLDGDVAMLLLPEGTDAGAIHLPGARESRGYSYGPFARLVTVSIDRPVALHGTPGPRTPVTAAFPSGAMALAVIGRVGNRTAELGTGWLLVGSVRQGGFAPARHIELATGCGAPTTTGSSGWTVPHGRSERFAWTLEPTSEGAEQSIRLFPATADCTLGEPVFTTIVRGAVTELSLVPATRAGPEMLVVLTTAADLNARERTVTVLGMGLEPIVHHTTTADAPDVLLGVTRGPNREAGYFPLTLEAAGRRTWLAWSGTGLTATTP